MKPRTKRGLAIVTGLAVLGIASALVLNAFQSNMVFFFSPTQVADKEAPLERSFRIGGLVVELFGHVPKRGDVLVKHGYRFTVIKADSRRLQTLLVEKVRSDA